ncbi:Fpg/Nei family DNA glycosylase [Herbidospora galbida]|uniref:DNA-(apurinic or apyrimidinic site) lyase n=1 Tax=Herbidospora galbida TaxID=2575442 RepID=A0A4U3MKT7_9ACTN|nr:DNA-formamidopyrimidine glycosylase family protein [Herbidospora galbida]TKK89134.1 Fpg/Nei family DNA glycosylase [Herbidospora galbida]
MPEGDAVYRTAKRLRAALDGRELTRSDFRVPRYATADLRGRRVLTTVSRGKNLLTRVEGGVTLHTHLRMDGSWRVTRAGTPLRGGDVVRVVLANSVWQAAGIKLGVVDLLPTANEDQVVGHLGPDLLGPDWDPDRAVANLLGDPDRTIGEALLDQRNLAGIGTIWRAETLFVSGVGPWRRTGDVADLAGLAETAHRLLVENKNEHGPVTTGDPRPGRALFVYGRAHLPCRVCGTMIERGEMGSQPRERLIYWCPRCQPG